MPKDLLHSFLLVLLVLSQKLLSHFYSFLACVFISTFYFIKQITSDNFPMRLLLFQHLVLQVCSSSALVLVLSWCLIPLCPN